MVRFRGRSKVRYPDKQQYGFNATLEYQKTKRVNYDLLNFE